MYPNLHPASHLELGDYGDVSAKTGKFIKSGNIIEDYPELGEKLAKVERVAEKQRHHFVSRSEGTAGDIDVESSAMPIFMVQVSTDKDLYLL
jgi:hypothetical protein